MTQIDVLKMAIEAGLAAETSDGQHQIWYPDNLCHFAKLVADKATAKEREACAKVADEYAKQVLEHNFSKLIAHNIRARGEQA